ncbi:hypothetical protein A3715_11320 [Oleiphilus sp. HI0009]|nr:hypothetical protein A3715_11320 [Oleiphilus sp. HI0009]
MTILNVVFDATTSDRFPAYEKYPQQYEAQRAYLQLNIKTGDLDIHIAPYGGGCTQDELNSVRINFSIPPTLYKTEIESLINEHKAAFQRFLNAAEIDWDGCNQVAKFAKGVQDELISLQQEFEILYSETVMIDDLAVFLERGDIFYPSKNQSPAEFAAELFKEDGQNNCWFSDNLAYEESILSALRQMWCDRLYETTDTLPCHVAQWLINDGCCDDAHSDHVIRLEAMAKGWYAPSPAAVDTERLYSSKDTVELGNALDEELARLGITLDNDKTYEESKEYFELIENDAGIELLEAAIKRWHELEATDV